MPYPLRGCADVALRLSWWPGILLSHHLTNLPRHFRPTAGFNESSSGFRRAIVSPGAVGVLAGLMSNTMRWRLLKEIYGP